MSGEVNILSPHWREVATHVVAFTAAVLVLRRYAWTPILNLLEERRTRIRNEFDGIARERESVAKIKSDYETQLRGIDQQARVKIQEGVAEGLKVGGEIKEKARQDARDLIRRAREEIEIEKDRAEVALKQDMVAMAIASAEKVIRQRLDEETQRRLASDFIDELRRMRKA